MTLLTSVQTNTKLCVLENIKSITLQSRGLIGYFVFVMRVERGMVPSCEAPGMSGKRRRGRTGTICHEIVFKRITHKVSIFLESTFGE